MCQGTSPHTHVQALWSDVPHRHPDSAFSSTPSTETLPSSGTPTAARVTHESLAGLGVEQGCLGPSAYIGGVILFSSRLEGAGAEWGLAAGSGVVGCDGEEILVYLLHVPSRSFLFRKPLHRVGPVVRTVLDAASLSRSAYSSPESLRATTTVRPQSYHGPVPYHHRR